MAAKFELEELNDVSAARVLIQQGLRSNSDSKHLWLEVSSQSVPHTTLNRAEVKYYLLQYNFD